MDACLARSRVEVDSGCGDHCVTGWRVEDAHRRTIELGLEFGDLLLHVFDLLFEIGDLLNLQRVQLGRRIVVSWLSLTPRTAEGGNKPQDEYADQEDHHERV
ncbi:hypothetical protein H6798_03530 [Candidatus Nomurabacteria bacterium]|nr:hypothetical protein [Candidatus Nomurabacteria bacterium]